jgi:two-component system sensor histidine kinase YesM
MVENIKKLINDVYVAEINFKDAQFNALQAQINPHFLYNTLETIHFMIVIGDNKAIKMVQLLGDLFRVGIGRGERFITLGQEVNHVRLYLEIQQIRYSNKFQVTIDMSEEVNQLYIIKFILQPIVENSIYHGIELMEEDGLISITGRIEAGQLVIRVTDNGIGMNESTLNELQDKLEGRIKTKGIGFTNVNERIRLNFGNEYGVFVESRENSGTTVTIRLPVIKENPENSTHTASA